MVVVVDKLLLHPPQMTHLQRSTSIQLPKMLAQINIPHIVIRSKPQGMHHQILQPNPLLHRSQHRLNQLTKLQRHRLSHLPFLLVKTITTLHYPHRQLVPRRQRWRQQRSVNLLRIDNVRGQSSGYFGAYIIPTLLLNTRGAHLKGIATHKQPVQDYSHCPDVLLVQTHQVAQIVPLPRTPIS